MKSAVCRSESGMTLVELAIITLVFVFLASIMIPIFEKARTKASDPTCISNLKQLGLATMMYCDENKGAFPRADTWSQDIYPYVKNYRVLCCPSAEEQSLPSYAMNRRLFGKDQGKLHGAETVVMQFDSIPASYLRGGPELLPELPRHNGGDCVNFADGHAKWVNRAKSKTLDWLIKP